MAVDAKKRRSGWVGRSIRRLEDPTLVAGHGRFTGDLPAARWVRFVRSSVACGPDQADHGAQGATVVTAADLAGVKPIQPMLHKFNYVPISQPVLARDVVRFVGEPIAAVVSLERREEAEDIADLVEVEIEDTAGGRRRRRGAGSRRAARPRRGRRQRRGRRTLEDARLRREAGARAPADQGRHPLAPAECAADGAARRACRLGRRQRSRHAHLRDADAARRCGPVIADLIGMPESDLRVIAPDVGGGFGQKMSLAAGIRGRDLARAHAQDVGGVGGGPARESRRLLPQPRPVDLARRRVRRRRAS